MTNKTSQNAVAERFGIIQSMPSALASIGFEPTALEKIRSLFHQIASELENLIAAEFALSEKQSKSASFHRYRKQCQQTSRSNPSVFRDLPGADQFSGLDVFPTWDCSSILSHIETIREIVCKVRPEEAGNANSNLNRFVRRIRTEWLDQARRLNRD